MACIGCVEPIGAGCDRRWLQGGGFAHKFKATRFTGDKRRHVNEPARARAVMVVGAMRCLW